MKSQKTNPFPPQRLITAALFGVCALSVGACGSVGSSSQAIKGPPDGGGGGGGGHDAGGGGETETAASNVAFPVILSDNVGPAAFPADGAWRFASITDPTTECIGEGGVSSGSAVPSSTNCYYGRHVTVSSETGLISFDGPTKVWWLQKRATNFWKAFSVGHDALTYGQLAVSAVDVGDLLESSPSIATRQIRTEFNLLQSVSPTDPEYGGHVVQDWTLPIPAQCNLPTAAAPSLGCFAALGMSGPVPGTQQTINEAQGTDFGPGGSVAWPGTQTLLDPTTVRTATTADGAKIPIHAVDYSNCARLVIQKVEGTPTWDKTTGRWAGSGVGAPVVNVAAYQGTYSAEINSGGGLVYGYNWNAKTTATGTYRLTFVLDGNDTQGPQCPTPLGTQFKLYDTQLVNVGENNASHIIYAEDSQLGDEGGLVYIDLNLSTRGGGGSKGGGGHGRP